MISPLEFNEVAAGIAHRLGQTRADVHSIVLSQGGHQQGAWYAHPRHEHTVHRMYSISKSMTALGVGLLIDDGVITLDSTMEQCFGGFAPMHEWTAKASIADLLSMRSPHESTAYKIFEGQWLESFFRVAPTHESGTVFRYDTGASYTLGALVERTVGTSLTSFLQDRIFAQLGVSDQMRYVQSSEGHSSGGSGLMCLPTDLVKIAHWINRAGVHESKQLLDPQFLELATTRQVSTAMATPGSAFQYGYGFQTWVPWPGAYLFFGMAGQLVLSIPQQDLVLVVTADCQRSKSGEQDLWREITQEILERFYPGVVPQLPLETTGQHLVAQPQELSGTFANLSPATSAALDNHGIEISLGATGGRIVWPARRWDVEFEYGTTVDAPDFGGFGFTQITAGWVNEELLTLVFKIQAEEVSSVEVALHVTAVSDRVTIQTQTFGELIPKAWNGVRTLGLESLI